MELDDMPWQAVSGLSLPGRFKDQPLMEQNLNHATDVLLGGSETLDQFLQGRRQDVQYLSLFKSTDGFPYLWNDARMF